MAKGMEGNSLQPYPSTGRSHCGLYILDAIANLRVPSPSEMEKHARSDIDGSM
jgi:hypothetical protein